MTRRIALAMTLAVVTTIAVAALATIGVAIATGAQNTRDNLTRQVLALQSQLAPTPDDPADPAPDDPGAACRTVSQLGIDADGEVTISQSSPGAPQRLPYRLDADRLVVTPISSSVFGVAIR